MIAFSENVISLRTAVFEDDGVLATLVLLPPDPDRRPDVALVPFRGQENLVSLKKRIVI